MNKNDLELHKANAPTAKKYTINCFVVKKQIPVNDVRSNGTPFTYYSDMVFLIPEVTSESSRFLDAWLPNVAYDEKGTRVHHEVLADFPSPINRTVRLAVLRKNKDIPDHHHLSLMSSEATEELLRPYIGRKITITILPDYAEGEKAD